MIPKTFPHTYEEFVDKWVNRSLYDSDYDYMSVTAGKIRMYRDDDYQGLSYMRDWKVVADIFNTPRGIAWKDDAQRKQFIKEAKMFGLRSNKSTKNEWYKSIDLSKK